MILESWWFATFKSNRWEVYISLKKTFEAICSCVQCCTMIDSLSVGRFKKSVSIFTVSKHSIPVTKEKGPQSFYQPDEQTWKCTLWFTLRYVTWEGRFFCNIVNKTTKKLPSDTLIVVLDLTSNLKSAKMNLFESCTELKCSIPTWKTHFAAISLLSNAAWV